MTRSAKLLAAMRANPAADWTIADIESLSSAHGITCKAPKRGSHYTLKHPLVLGRLSIPARRPIKPVYIRLLLEMIDCLPEA